MNRFFRSSACVALSLLAACASQREGEAGEQPYAELGTTSAAIVYGEDDRLDVYAHPDALWRERVKASSIALIQPRFLQRPPSGRVSVSTETLAERNGLCPGEAFADQPASADCSATLIDRDLVLTAGHCFEDDQGCDTYSYVFDYFYASEGQLEPLSAADVFGCRDFVTRRVSPKNAGKQIDFAIVQLDRPALAPREPASISPSVLKNGDAVVTLGFTSGLPAKIDSGSQVIDARAATMDYFKLNSDTFAGSSGSGLFDRQGGLVGVLVRGGEDYVTTDAGCNISKQIPSDSDGSPWEQATYATSAIEALCATGWPSAALCGIEPSCGDGFCTMDEVAGSCAADCANAVCSRPPCTKGAQPMLVAGTPSDEAADEDASDGGVATKTRKPEGCTISVGRAPASEFDSLGLFGIALLALTMRRNMRTRRLRA